MLKKILCLILILSMMATIPVYGEFEETNKCENQDIDQLVEKIMGKSKVPGLSIVIVNGDKKSYLSYGYGNKMGMIKATENTYYEIGSMSKAFTALGILKLEAAGKINLKDKVEDYIPWFRVHYKGKYQEGWVNEDVSLTIADLLYHTSGIPFDTIGYIPEGLSDYMLEKTVKNIVGINLDYYPGERHQYATINYDILGLIIQTVTGQAYESYMNKEILTPLGLSDIYLFHEELLGDKVLAKGYKINFLRVKEFEAPKYRGNTPAGYFIANSKAMGRFMEIQMGLIPVTEQVRKLVIKSHLPNTEVVPDGNYFYGGGWDIHTKRTVIKHSGNNPNYSSVIRMLPEKKIGVCVLSNMNSNAADYLAENILNLLQGKSIGTYKSDMYKQLDLFFSILIIIITMLSVFYGILLLGVLKEIKKGLRVRKNVKDVKVAGIRLAVPITAYFIFCIYYLPNILFDRLPWNAVEVWSSTTIKAGCVGIGLIYIIFMIYVILTFNFPKEKEFLYWSVVPLSLLNGISSAFIIFTINETFQRNLFYSKELFLYFIFFLIFFVYTLKLLQEKMIIIANELVYEKRMYMLKQIMQSTYQRLEEIGKDRVYTGLNNDCLAVSEIPGLIVNFISDILTLIFCLMYLWTRNIYAFLISLSIILLNGLIGFLTSRMSIKYWENNRDIQDIYFGQMQDLVNGFKELILNMPRKLAFFNDMEIFTRKSAELNKYASIKFLNFDLYNTLMYNLVFGVVVFVFPLLVYNIDSNILRENLFIVFYMIGPFNSVANAIPRLTQTKVHMDRIDELIKCLNESTTEEEHLIKGPLLNNHIVLEFKKVKFKYSVKVDTGEGSENEFILGPLSMTLKSGEIIFIVGGNGSGKSTLGKLISGLYQPTEGNVYLNGNIVSSHELNHYFAAVYSDFNLFKKLYGIDLEAKRKDIMKYLQMMKLDDKIELTHDGEFKSISLSTGQKKRLAFIVSCIENKPIMIFDEWAAEQDPQFREFFYTQLLLNLKEQGKCVIVITHDDRYFDMANKLIKMEHGKIV